jgi:hypothetical protein
VAAVALVWAACSTRAEDDLIRVEVQRLALADGDAASISAERVARYGRRALATIEAVIQTADPHGRKNLVLAARRVGDAEAVPLLLHVAAWDAEPLVRAEAEWTLKSWAAATDERAERARAALRRLDELKQREEAG